MLKALIIKETKRCLLCSSTGIIYELFYILTMHFSFSACSWVEEEDQALIWGLHCLCEVSLWWLSSRGIILRQTMKAAVVVDEDVESVLRGSRMTMQITSWDVFLIWGQKTNETNAEMTKGISVHVSPKSLITLILLVFDVCSVQTKGLTLQAVYFHEQENVERNQQHKHQPKWNQHHGTTSRKKEKCIIADWVTWPTSLTCLFSFTSVLFHSDSNLALQRLDSNNNFICGLGNQTNQIHTQSRGSWFGHFRLGIVWLLRCSFHFEGESRFTF